MLRSLESSGLEPASANARSRQTVQVDQGCLRSAHDQFPKRASSKPRLLRPKQRLHHHARLPFVILLLPYRCYELQLLLSSHLHSPVTSRSHPAVPL